MKFSAKWLAAPIELELIPSMGKREIKKVELDGAEALAVSHDAGVLAFHNLIFASSRTLAAFGAAKVKEAWDDYVLSSLAHMVSGDVGALIWPVESFESNLKDWKDRLFVQYACAEATDEALVAAMAAFGKELAERSAKVPPGSRDRLVELPLLAFYWHLRASGVKEIVTPAGKKTVDWSLEPEKRKVAMDLLAEVIDEADLAALSTPTRKPFDMEELKPVSAADVEGKSGKGLESSMESRPASTPSSAQATATMNA